MVATFLCRNKRVLLVSKQRCCLCRDQRGNQTIFTNEAKVKSIQSCYSQLEKIDESPDRERVNRTSPGREISREASDREKEKSQIASSPSVDLNDLLLFLLPDGQKSRKFPNRERVN